MWADYVKGGASARKSSELETRVVASRDVGLELRVRWRCDWLRWKGCYFGSAFEAVLSVVCVASRRFLFRARLAAL